eukprot:gnl/TRDRNA2_/TRDRNA2_66126_c0_seq1.p1 gnl/TRDRNA2_/TRDRNA2_66126_c0~~gnl/TRDRNA2_/TRDRNA2_66126_c0_seq1.p1  ORF type:complete len:635 (+),score=95.67 gnl/TRDRNA2_/TRDRNA2_66126_c0_seq1:253-2157(+)
MKALEPHVVASAYILLGFSVICCGDARAVTAAHPTGEQGQLDPAPAAQTSQGNFPLPSLLQDALHEQYAFHSLGDAAAKAAQHSQTPSVSFASNLSSGTQEHSSTKLRMTQKPINSTNNFSYRVSIRAKNSTAVRAAQLSVKGRVLQRKDSAQERSDEALLQVHAALEAEKSETAQHRAIPLHLRHSDTMTLSNSFTAGEGHLDRHVSSSHHGEVQVLSLNHNKQEPTEGWVIAAIVIGVGIIGLGVCVVMAMPSSSAGDQNSKAADGVDAEKARNNAALTTSSSKGNLSPPAGGLGMGPESREPTKSPQSFTYGAPPTQGSPAQQSSPGLKETSPDKSKEPSSPPTATGTGAPFAPTGNGGDTPTEATLTPVNTPPAGGGPTKADSLLRTSLSQTSLRGIEEPGGLRHSPSASGSDSATFLTNTNSFVDSSAVGASSLQFCPNLVVPEGCECILFVPLRTMAGGPFTVADINGKLVLRVTQQNAPHQFAPQQQSGGTAQGSVFRSLVLTTSAGGVLAQCCAAKPSAPPGTPGEAEFHLLRASGEYFARLVRMPASEDYMLDALSGMRLHFSGDFEEHIVRVTDDDGLLVATTEPCTVDFEEGNYDRLRVAPMTDVGLVLCSLLCLDHLGEGQA